MTYCDDCPDKEACHQGMSCDAAREFAAAATVYRHIHRQNMKGVTMAKNNTEKVTVESVAAQAAEEKLVVPAQATEAAAEEKNTDQAETNESPELKVIEGGKKSLKERLASVTEKLKQNQKTLIAVGAAASVAALAFAKYAKKKAEEALVEEYVEPETSEDTAETDVTSDESAA